MTRQIARAIAMFGALMVGVVGVGTISAQEERSSQDFVVILSYSAPNCTAPTVNYIGQRSSNLYTTVVVNYNGSIVSDSVWPFAPGSGVNVLLLSYFNHRGLAPVNLYPLAPGVPLHLTITLWTPDWEPLYQTSGVISSCASATIIDITHGPVYSLTRNHSFETIGLDESGATQSTLAAFWKGKNAANDVRTCDTTADFVGSCGLKIVAEPAAVSKLTNKYTGTVGSAGDTILLYFYADAFVAYTGVGKVMGKLKLANGQKVKLALDLTPSESWNSETPRFIGSAPISAPVVSAKTIIKQGAAAGSVAVDAVTLSVVTNTDDAPRAALPVPAFGASQSSGAELQ